MMTLAPELPGAVSLVERLVRSGIVPALGHTAASREEIAAATVAGARISTHLGNGSHAMIPRHHNYIWEQLAQDGLWASLIVDGHHLPPAVVKVFIRAKGIERCILTSDAVWLAGQEPGIYDFLGVKVELTPSQGVRLIGTEYLAGSALDLATAVANVVPFAGVGLADAVAMASERPAQLFGRDDLGGLAPGQAGDAVLARWHEEEARLEVLRTVVAGEVVYTSPS
jgi:N-acetylglucosamine-6-phosphate deacetylase